MILAILRRLDAIQPCAQAEDLGPPLNNAFVFRTLLHCLSHVVASVAFASDQHSNYVCQIEVLDEVVLHFLQDFAMQLRVLRGGLIETM